MDWKQCKHVRKKHFFGSYKNVSFPKPDFIPQGSFHKKGNPQRGIAPFISDPRIAPPKKNIPCDPTKRSFHVIPQRECEKKNRALKYYVLQSWVCSMGWSGDRERERGVATSHFQSHKDKGSAKKTIFQIAKNCFVRKARFHPIAQKGKSTKGICTFISDPRIAEQKTSHFIPQSVHSTSFHRGNAEKQFYRA